MRALQITARGKAEFVDAPKPQLQHGSALVQPRLLSLCGSDIWLMDHAPEHRYPCPPGTTGHEVIAEVIEVSGPSDLRPGQLTLTLAPDHCGMAEYYAAPLENILPLPTRKTAEEYLMAQQLGTVIYACRFLPNLVGKTVAVIGQGSAGLWFNVICKRLAARRIIALDSHPHRRALSKQYGADAVLDGRSSSAVEEFLSLNNGELADVVIEAAGRESAINLSYELAKDLEGFILQFGLPREPLNVRYGNMFWKRLTVKSIVHAAREPHHTSTLHALELIDQHLDVMPLLTHRFAFDDVHNAFHLQRTASEGAVKTLVEMP